MNNKKVPCLTMHQDTLQNGLFLRFYLGQNMPVSILFNLLCVAIHTYNHSQTHSTSSYSSLPDGTYSPDHEQVYHCFPIHEQVELLSSSEQVTTYPYISRIHYDSTILPCTVRFLCLSGNIV